MATIIEALHIANHSLDNMAKIPAIYPLVKEQLHNAVVLLDKGYDIWTEIEPLLDKHGSVEDVPDIDNNYEINQDD